MLTIGDDRMLCYFHVTFIIDEWPVYLKTENLYNLTVTVLLQIIMCLPSLILIKYRRLDLTKTNQILEILDRI